MASLIAPLAAGINGCPSGTAEIYQRGTSTAAVVYSYDSSRDTLTQVTSHPLDANGAVVRYVIDPVDVVCKDSSGVAQRTFTWETRADIVEVRNLGFTGTLPTGGQGAGGRTDVDTVLTSLFTSLGATDGKVLINGAGQNIRDVLSGTTSVFFSVTNTIYGGGAKGNGTADDTGAIQAAINAAAAAGGGIVYLPPGTYKTTSSITVSNSKIWLMGVNPSASIIASTSATSVFSGAPQFVSGLAITSASGSSVVSECGGSHWLNCTFAYTVGSGAFTISAAPFTAAFTDCSFTQNGTTGNTFNLTNAAASIQVNGGTFSVTNAAPGNVVGGTAGSVQISGASIAYSGGGGTLQFVAGVAALTTVFAACNFLNSMSLGPPTVGPAPNIFDVGCTSSVANAIVNPGIGAWVSSLRDSSLLRTTGSATTYAPNAALYQTHDVTSSGASFQFQNPTPVPQAADSFRSRLTLTLRYKNTSGGAITPTFGANFKIGTAPSVGANQAAVFNFVYDFLNGFWLQVGGNSVAYAA